jgi:uncharacterized damage-inducible protein DinB
MDMLEHFRRLFAYDEWANREVLAGLRQNPNPRSLELLAHVLAAQKVWLERLVQEKQSVPVWPEFTLEQCEARISDLSRARGNYFAGMTPAALTGTVRYQNTKGESFSNSTQDVLMHVVMHSAYHRGQIATQMRAAGLTPASTDFIHAIRQGSVE